MVTWYARMKSRLTRRTGLCLSRGDSRCGGPEGGGKRSSQMAEGHLARGSGQTHNKVESGARHQKWGDRGTKPSLRAITLDRSAGARDGESHSRRHLGSFNRPKAKHTRTALTASFSHRGNPASPGKAMPPVHRVGAGVRRLRPLRRRAFSTWRPPGVDMRIRNPCVLRRYFFLGWYVRLMAVSPRHGSRRGRSRRR